MSGLDTNKKKKGTDIKKTYWIVKLDIEKCSICEMCAYRCPTGAISIRHIDGYEELVYDYKLCDGCDGELYCQQYCPEEAIQLVEKKRIRKGSHPVVLITGQITNCINCGVSFVPQKKIEVIQNKPDIEVKYLLSCCPDCRRKALVTGVTESLANS